MLLAVNLLSVKIKNLLPHLPANAGNQKGMTMLDKIEIDFTTFKMYFTMPWGKGATPSMRYKSAVEAAKELATAEWLRLCQAGDPRISLTDDIVNGDVVSIDDGATVLVRMQGSDRGYSQVGIVNIPGVVRRALKGTK